QLQFRGPSATRGYFHNPEANRRLLKGEWLDSGDLAYMAGGDLYLTGRAKDIIIKAGRNIYPQEVEQAVSEVPGVRKGCVALFGSRDPETGTERIVLLAETREQDPEARERLRRQIEAVANDLLGMPLDDLVLAPPQTVPKTSSGKIRRAASRELYEQGMPSQGRRQVWLQFLRLALSALLPQMRRLGRSVAEFTYAGYAWLLFTLFAVPVWSLVVALPSIKARWWVMGRSARLLSRLLGIDVRVDGIERLPRDRQLVLTANHASYLDGILLVATLPIRFVFIAKVELQRQLIPRLFLTRVGCEFVERNDARQGLADSRRITERVKRGENLLFFPEGTFDRMPGLLPFRMGAFMVAAEAGVPVVPVAIQGTRSLLRAESWMPRRGEVLISVAEPVMPVSSEWSAVVELRDRVRQAILRRPGEPDASE
ncbi:MAG TPA: acyl-phosphate glycerol 3-phosphate acyltransferase, partial [Sedimenticola sp.]|nr:acyl-phosphate glycerol 3-phosphate acyltransferase [Sedimenticola sp.]